MEIVSISKNKFDNLKPMILPKGIRNTECDLFHFRYHNREMVLKKLYFTNGNSFGNKLYTLEALTSNQELIPNYFILPEFLVAINKRIEAFTLPYIKGTNLSKILDDPQVDYEDKKYYLKRVGQILEQMKNIRKFTTLNDFYLGDLHEDNFIVDMTKKEIYVNDVDSVKIAGNLSFPARYLNSRALLNCTGRKYHLNEENHSLTSYSVDENTDLYCYIIMILNYLYGDNINNIDIEEYYNYLNYLDSLKINNKLLECFERILSNGNNINPVLYIDTLTAGQIGQANKKIYNLRR